MKFRVVVTANRRLWDEYGQRAMQTWLDHWPTDGSVELILYAEDFDTEIAADDRVTIREMPAWHTAWKVRHVDNKDAHGRATIGKLYDFRRDCVRFSHKPAVLTDAAARSPRDGIMIMMDADVISHRPVTTDWLKMLLPSGRYMAWLDRRGWYPECGFVMFREDHASHAGLMQQLRAAYEHDSVFSMPQTHDSWVLMTMVNRLGIRPFDLSKQGGSRDHPFTTSILGERLDHLKGKRKAGERSPEVGRR